MNWEQEEQEVEELRFKLASLGEQLDRERLAFAKSKRHVRQAKEAQVILQELAQAVQQEAHAKIAEVVSLCLSIVFEDPYEFKITFHRKRGRTEAKLSFVRNGLEVDPLTASGGGVVDVAAFALRVACLVLHKPPLRRLLVLDEPFRFVSVEYQDNVRSMLEQVADRMKIQIILVTHNDNMVVGKVVKLQ